MNKLPELFFVRTIPFTGTNFFKALLKFVDPKELRVGEIHANELIEIFTQATNKQISYNELIVKSLHQCKFSHKLKLFGIFEHLYTPENGNIEQYCKNNSQIFKNVFTLRDYRRLTLSNLIHSIGSEQVRLRNQFLTRTRKALEFITDRMNDKNCTIIPIDKLGEYCTEDKLKILNVSLFDFLGTKPKCTEDFCRFVEKWQPLHRVENNFRKIERNKEFELLMELRKYEQDGMHAIYDEEVAFYENNEKIQRLYRKYGYKKKLTKMDVNK